jgi:hypothetical protein
MTRLHWRVAAPPGSAQPGETRSVSGGTRAAIPIGVRWVPIALAAIGAAGCGFTPVGEATGEADAAVAIGGPDGGGGGGGGDETCAPGQEGCTCIGDPGPGGCVHSYGGRFGNGACSPAYQCCDGAWIGGQGSCGECTCVADGDSAGCGTSEKICFPDFAVTVSELSPELRAEMTGSSWHPELACPSFDSLRLMQVPHWGFDGAIHTGELVVAADVVPAVEHLFERLYVLQFPIERMERVDVYGGDDDASMAANNTSAFNCRQITGGGTLSRHSYGVAIDINPVQNPYVTGATVLPSAGAEYRARTPIRPGMIVRPDPVTRALVDIGWEWGGDWDDPIDYQHVSTGG